MNTINDLLKVDLSKIPQGELRSAIENILKDYQEENDKKAFEQEAAINIQELYQLVQVASPQAIPGNEGDTNNANGPKEGHGAKVGTGKPTQGPTTEKHTSKDIGALDKEGKLDGQPNGHDGEKKGHRENEEKQGQKEIGTNGVSAEKKGQEEVKKKNEIRDGQEQMENGPKKGERDNGHNEKEGAASKRMMEKVGEYEKGLEACRAVIREYNKQKREVGGPKTKKSRRTLLVEKFLSIVKLTPWPLAGDELVQKKNDEIVKNGIKSFLKNWGMDITKPMEKAVEKGLGQIEDKAEEIGQRLLAKKWKEDLPSLEKVMEHEKKYNKEMVKSQAEEVLKKIKDAIHLFAKDKAKALQLLKKDFSKQQLEAYIPSYITDEMKMATQK